MMVAELVREAALAGVRDELPHSIAVVVEEMVQMILGQRAYEANSRVIRAADEMLQQVNSLWR